MHIFDQAGRDCKIKSILRPEEMKSTEKFIRRDNRFKGILLWFLLTQSVLEVAKRMKRIASVRDEQGRVPGDPRMMDPDRRRTLSVPPWGYQQNSENVWAWKHMYHYRF